MGVNLGEVYFIVVVVVALEVGSVPLDGVDFALLQHLHFLDLLDLHLRSAPYTLSL